MLFFQNIFIEKKNIYSSMYLESERYLNVFTYQLSIIPLVYSTKLPYSIIKRIKLDLIYITKKIEI